MSQIKVEHLTFTYPGSYDPVFSDVSFCIDTDWRLGFIGRNGKGKTTFLRLLCEAYPYEGTITSSAEFDYFPYEVRDTSRSALDVLSEVCPAAEEWELRRELSFLETDPEILYRPFDTLSFGERTKAMLAALFLNDGRFLLIDEPTNHLDAEGRAVLSAYLKRKKGYILVSHDRAFLDGCVDHILSLNRADIEIQSGNFSSWFQNFTVRNEAEEARNAHLEKDIKRLKDAASRTKSWSDRTEKSKVGCSGDKGYIGHKAAKMMKRSKAIEARRTAAIEEKSALLQNAEENDPLELFPQEYHSDLLTELSEVTIFYGEKPISKPVSFQIRKGDRIALCGKNGSGKSSILKLLTGEQLSYTGRYKKGLGVLVSYVPQDTSDLRGTLREFAKKNFVDETRFLAILRKMDFERVQFEKDIADFSGGQKKKVLLARSLAEHAHLYVWDEPLNFVDLYSRIQLEEVLTEFCPTMVFVEHDRTFTDAVATQRIIMEDLEK